MNNKETLSFHFQCKQLSLVLKHNNKRYETTDFFISILKKSNTGKKQTKSLKKESKSYRLLRRSK